MGHTLTTPPPPPQPLSSPDITLAVPISLLLKKKLYLLISGGICENAIHPGHFDYNGPIAQRVPNSSQPGSEVAKHCHGVRISGGNDSNDTSQVKDDGSDADYVVEFGTGEFYQPERGGGWMGGGRREKEEQTR